MIRKYFATIEQAEMYMYQYAFTADVGTEVVEYGDLVKTVYFIDMVL
jgi:hypothetical protein